MHSEFRIAFIALKHVLAVGFSTGMKMRAQHIHVGHASKPMRIMGYMRMVRDRLAVRGVPTFMVEAKPGQSFAELTRMGLGRAKGMVAFCTAEYGAYTRVGYETFRELEFAHDKELLLIPIRLCEVWPPAPTDNERGTWQNKLVFPNGLMYIDDQQMQNAESVADQIADTVAHLGLFGDATNS
jgi:hypothetical protein